MPFKTVVIFAAVAVALLAAACTSSPAAEPAPPVPETASVTDPGLPDDLLLQLAWEPSFFRIESFVPFGRPPRFALFTDGRVIYLHEGGSASEQVVMEARLTPGGTQGLLQAVMEAGFERLENSTEDCIDLGGGTKKCVMDAVTTVFRARLPSGELREVKAYSDFSNDRSAFLAIKRLMSGFQHPDAERYAPDTATLFFDLVRPRIEGWEVREWPLDDSILAPPGEGLTRWAIVIAGDELASLISVLPRNMGDYWFETETGGVSVYLVPWLPGADYSDEVESWRRGP